MSDQLTTPIPTWKQAAYDALAATKKADRQRYAEQERADGEALANQIRRDLPEIADRLLDGFTPPSNRMIVDGYVFQRRHYDSGSGFLVLGRLLPDGSILFASDYPAIVHSLAALGTAMEEVDMAYAAKASEEAAKLTADKLKAIVLSPATRTAVEFMTTLCERVVRGQELDPEQEFVLATAKYIAGIAPVEDTYADVSDIPY